MSLNEQLEILARQLTDAGDVAENGTFAAVEVKLSAVLNLGFDPGEVVTAEKLKAALLSQLNARLTAGDFGPGSEIGETLLDEVSLVETRDE